MRGTIWIFKGNNTTPIYHSKSFIVKIYNFIKQSAVKPRSIVLYLPCIQFTMHGSFPPKRKIWHINVINLIQFTKLFDLPCIFVLPEMLCKSKFYRTVIMIMYDCLFTITINLLWCFNNLTHIISCWQMHPAVVLIRLPPYHVILSPNRNATK